MITEWGGNNTDTEVFDKCCVANVANAGNDVYVANDC